MSTYTTNYNLEKPDSTDDFKDFRSNYNSNMDIIDANLGGGGGNVDDVLVNGVSVVDGNHNAQITSYKEVTQAEYDALPATKLTDGIAYFIKDAGGGGSSSHNYSTTEQVIGTWIDGKPLYEKVVAIPNTVQFDNSYTYPHGITNQDFARIVNAVAYDSSSKNVFDMPLINNDGASLSVRLNSTDIIFRGSANLVINNNRTMYVVIQYTKTTD